MLERAWKRLGAVPIRRLVSGVGFAAALVIALCIPAGYGIVAYLKRVDSLALKADLSARRAAEHLNATNGLWPMDMRQFLAQAEAPARTSSTILHRILDATGATVTEAASDQEGPFIRRQAPIAVAGNVVGRVELATSLRPLLGEVGLIGAMALVVAGAAYLAFAVLPLKVVDRSLGELQTANETLSAALREMVQGLAMFDAEERLVIANDRYAELYGLDPKDQRPGMSLRQIVQLRIDKGLYPGLTADDVVRNMRGRIGRCRSSRMVSQPGNGRILSVSIQPRAVGGWIVTLHDITERERLAEDLEERNELLKEQEAKLRAQNLQLDAALANMSQGLCMFDAEQRVVLANKRYAEMYGMTPEQVRPGTTLTEILEARIAKGLYKSLDTAEFLRRGVSSFHETVSATLRLADGRSISVVRRPLACGGVISTHEDVTDREKLNARLQRQNVQLDAALNNMIQGLAMFDAEQRVVVANARYAEMYGLTQEQVKPGTTLREIVEQRLAMGHHPGQSVEDVLAPMLSRVAGRTASHYDKELADGRTIAVCVQPMADGGTVTTHQDITEQRRSEAKIVHMALHDTLTGLPNRTLLNERLEHALEHARDGHTVAVHMLDLDHFKSANDTFGHAAGDTLLKMVAERLRALVRETDTIARMGGDEFAIVQAPIARPADATALAHRVIELVSAPYDIDGQQVSVGASVGIAVGPADGLSPDNLIRNADIALYRAKGDGRGTLCFFEAEMDAQMQTRRVLEQDLRKALAAQEFELYYQPVVSLLSGEITGFEALVRWRRPGEGMVAPSTFIPLAEEIGFIVPLGEWVLREACATAASWPEQLKVAVNLSPAQLGSPGLLQVVVGALASSGLAAERLELEITETALLGNGEATLGVLYQLRELGVRIAMDDFGTGYSSLSHLQSFPFDKIKIDRSFVKDITEGVGSLNIVRAVAALADGLGMTSTAEGVETEAQLETVRAEGCTEMQGFLFSRPIPARDVQKLLRSHAGRPKDAEAACETAAAPRAPAPKEHRAA